MSVVVLMSLFFCSLWPTVRRQPKFWRALISNTASCQSPTLRPSLKMSVTNSSHGQSGRHAAAWPPPLILCWTAHLSTWGRSCWLPSPSMSFSPFPYWPLQQEFSRYGNGKSPQQLLMWFKLVLSSSLYYKPKQQSLSVRSSWLAMFTLVSVQVTVPRRCKEYGKSAGQPMRSHALSSRSLPLIYINTSVIRVFCHGMQDKPSFPG